MCALLVLESSQQWAQTEMDARKQQTCRFEQNSYVEVIPLLLNTINLSVTSIVKLACCSSSCRRLVGQFTQQTASSLLPRAVRAAAGAHKTHLERATQCVRWLTAAAGLLACIQGALAAAITSIPRVPLQVAAILLDAGLRITEDQLGCAARTRVAGVEAWVVLGDSGLPVLMEACCCSTLELVEAGDLPAFLDLQHQQLADLLHIAVNKQNPETAQRILQRLQRPATEAAWQMTSAFQQTLELKLPRLVNCIQPELLGQLMTTACHRGHSLVLSQLCELPAAAKVPASIIADMLQLLLAKQDQGPAVSSLCKLEGAKQMPPSAAAPLLQTAVAAVVAFPQLLQLGSLQHSARERSLVCLKSLVKIRRRQSMSTPALDDIFGMALSHHSNVAVEVLLQLREAQSTAGRLQLLRLAIQQRCFHQQQMWPESLKCIKLVLEEMSDYEPSLDTVVQLLKSAALCRDQQVFNLLRKKFHDAHHMASYAMQQLMRLAVQQRNGKMLKSLKGLRAAAMLDHHQAADTMKAAVRTGQHTAHQLLCQELEEPDITPAVVLAVQLGRRKALQQLCSMDNDIWMCSDVLGNLLLHALSAAVQCNNLPALQQVCSKLDECDAIPVGQLHAVMHLTVALTRQDAFNVLCSSKWFDEVCSNSKCSIRDAAVQQGMDVIALLQSTNAADLVQPDQGLVGRLEHSKHCWHALGLMHGVKLSLDIDDLDPYLLSSVLQLLLQPHQQGAVNAAVTGGSAAATPTLCQPSVLSLPGIDGLGAEGVGRLLLAAVQLQNVAVVQQLCTLEDLDYLEYSQAAYLLETAVDMHYSSCLPYHQRDNQSRILQCISQLETMGELPGDWLLDSMHAAVEHNGDLAVKIVSSLPGAMEFGAPEVLQLLQAALHSGSSNIVSCLCSLDGASRLAFNSVFGLIQVGLVQCHRNVHVGPLCDLLWKSPHAQLLWPTTDGSKCSRRNLEVLLSAAVEGVDDREEVAATIQCLLRVSDTGVVPVNHPWFNIAKTFDVDEWLEQFDLRVRQQRLCTFGRPANR